MNDKNKTTLKIVLVILLGLALLATLISCCVVGTKHDFKNSVSYASEGSQLSFITLDSYISGDYPNKFYGIRFNSEALPEELGQLDLFSFSIIGSSVTYIVSIYNERVYIKEGSNIIITSGFGQKHGVTNTIRIIEVE